MKMLGVFQEDLRQEIDGLQAEELDCPLWTEILQDKDDSRSGRGAVPDERETTYFSFSRSKRLS